MEFEVFVKLCSPGVLDTVPGPENLLSPGGAGEHHGLVQLSLLRLLHGAVRGQRPQLDVVNEGDVVGRMPVLTQQSIIYKHFFLIGNDLPTKL